MVTSPFRKDLVAGKVALITGGGTGIGLGIATEFVGHGGRVCISGRREEVLKKAVAELGGPSKAIYVQGDVRDFASCERMVAECVKAFGRLDVLVNNAAGNFAVASEDISPNALKTVMEIDFHGSFNMSKASLEALKATKGLIVSTSATLYYKAFPFQMHASSAKAAIDTMMNALGVEWGAAHGIRAVSVAPGPIENTVGGPTGRVFGGQMKQNKVNVSDIVPIGRYGTVQDIAFTVLFLASEGGSFINATKIVVDGGHWHETSAQFLKGRDAVRAISRNEKKTTKGGVAKL